MNLRNNLFTVFYGSRRSRAQIRNQDLIDAMNDSVRCLVICADDCGGDVGTVDDLYSCGCIDLDSFVVIQSLGGLAILEVSCLEGRPVDDMILEDGDNVNVSEIHILWEIVECIVIWRKDSEGTFATQRFDEIILLEQTRQDGEVGIGRSECGDAGLGENRGVALVFPFGFEVPPASPTLEVPDGAFAERLFGVFGAAARANVVILAELAGGVTGVFSHAETAFVVELTLIRRTHLRGAGSNGEEGGDTCGLHLVLFLVDVRWKEK